MLSLPFKLILASNSPRRKQILRDVGFEFEVMSKNVEEIYPAELQRHEIPLYLSKLKGEALRLEVKNQMLIAADTIVLLDNEVIGKPESLNHAKQLLTKLSGKVHEVITGVYLYQNNKEVQFYETTKVHFRVLSNSEIDFYIQKYQPLDKAGAYGVQDWLGLTTVSKIEGCYYNVMGLPMMALYQKLKNWE